MKRNALLVAVCSISMSVFTACQPGVDTNRSTNSAANANAAKEPINPVAIETEVTKLEREWAAGAQRHDAEAVAKILADDLVMVYPDGVTGNKSTELRDIASKAMTADSWELHDLKVTVLGPDAAFVTGRGVVKNGKYKAPDSKAAAIDISGEYRFTSIYARRGGQWQAVASQTTQIRNPTPPAPAASPTK